MSHVFTAADTALHDTPLRTDHLALLRVIPSRNADDRINTTRQLTDDQMAQRAQRVLATVVFTDIVGSTGHALTLGDERWSELLEQHHSILRRTLACRRGREIQAIGDGFLVGFDIPSRAVRWAAAVQNAVTVLGVEIRCGIHAGECIRVGGDLAGIAVHIGARICSIAEPSEVLVSSTVKDLTAGSDLRFRDRGTQQLKGIPDPWRTYALDTMLSPQRDATGI